MAENIKSGKGMRQRDALKFDMRDMKDAQAGMDALVEAWTIPGERDGDTRADAENRESAARCTAILANVGLADLMDGKGAVNLGPLRDKGFDEDSAEYIAAHWLGAYNRMMAQRQRALDSDCSPSTIGMMLMHAQEMGRLQDRMWWRAGIDPQTGKRREQLAVGKREQERAIPKATEARRIQAKDTKPDWHDSAILDALEIRDKHPSYSRWRIAGEIHEKFGVSRNRCDKVLRANGIE